MCIFIHFLFVYLLIILYILSEKGKMRSNLFIHLAETHCIAGMSTMLGASDIEVKVKYLSSRNL